jgi:sulfite exporter TauE/SafE
MDLLQDINSLSFISIFVASLIGSGHCVGMCGGIVLLYAHGNTDKVKSHFAYNFGRLNSYILLGAVAGFLGKSLDLASSAAGIGKGASIVFGGFLVLWGLMILFSKRSPDLLIPGFGAIQKLYKRVGAESSSLAAPARAYILGLLSTLLPCGWLYSFAAIAAATGGVLSGMVVMFLFWGGTLPYMVSVGVASQALLGPLRKHLPVLTGVLIILGGVFSISQHYMAFGTAHLLSGKQMESGHHCH